jgi:dTDP-4-dehydrorhamnose reductase
MRILITGSNGQLGRELVRGLTGHELFPFGRAEADIEDPAVIPAILDTKCEVIIHAAALTDVDACELDPERAHRVNVAGTGHVAAAASRLGARLVYVSTDYVFDGAKPEPYTEEDQPNPINVYGRTKLEGERTAQRFVAAALIVRTAWVYGLGTRNFVTEILRLARANKTLRVVDDQVGSPTWARDLAEVIRDLVRLGASGIVHAAGAGACSRFELARAIVALAGLDTEVLPTTTAAFPRPARRPVSSPLAQRRLAELGLSTPPWAESLRAYFKALDGPPPPA